MLMAASSMNVHVRQEHIDLAQHGSPDRCPLALALLEKEHTEWIVSEEYCNPLLKPQEQWLHTPESSLLLDIWDNVGTAKGTELRPQTVKLIRKTYKKKVASGVS
jgi:hypothetical protein